MRSLAFLVIGILVGSTAASVVAQQQNGGIVGLNHVALAVENVDEAVAYYTQKLGFPEAFRVSNDKGQPTLVYVQVSRNTFIELQPVNAQRPAGINHLGIHVEDIRATVAGLKQRGVTVEEPRNGSTSALLANIAAPGGIRIELSELPPVSLQRQAMERWK